jgi:hypothetical protein
LLNISSAPSLTRYTLGLPQGYSIGATASAWGKLYFSPSLESSAGGSPEILAFDPKSNELSRLSVGRKLALVKQLFFVPERDSLLMLGVISTSANSSGEQLAWLDAQGGLTPLAGAENVVLAAVCPGWIAYVVEAEEKATPGDISPQNFRLVVVPTDASSGDKRSLLLNAQPIWLGIGDGGETAFLLAEAENGFGDLWAVNTLSRGRSRLRGEVITARMSPSSDACIVLPAAKNQLELFAPVEAGG